jgi:adenylate cyclase
MASTRRLTAILAADVAAYSRLMGADEEGTHERVKAHLAQLVDPKIKEHRGRTVKNTGDGLLAEFPSVVDAVRCAAEVQRGMLDRERTVAEERRIRFRIGINLGDIIVEEHDIFGDGVNVATRLEALAEPGGICISRTVSEQILDKLPYRFEDKGEQSVKNIARPVRVYALRPETIADLPEASAPPAKPAVPPAIAPRLSIVVLPFANLSDDREQQYIADAITEDLTTDLSRIADMFVISRNTAFTYRDKSIDTKQIGRELSVRYVLGGSVQRSGNRVRVNAQLIDAETDAHLWAERFAGDASDLFALQDKITSRIAVTLNLQLTAAEAARPTDHPGTLEYFLQGRAALMQRPSRDRYTKAIGLFERALTLDPGSAEVKSRLATVLLSRVMDQMTDSRAADIKRAETLAGQALAASPGSPSVHYGRGQILRVQGRYEEAIPEYEAVIASDRNSVRSLHALGQCKFFIGSIEESVRLQEQAIRLSPRDPFVANFYFDIARARLLQLRIDEAIGWLEKARTANPAHPPTHAVFASAYGLKGETERAAAELAEARRLSADDRYSSITRLRAVGNFGVPKIRALYEATYFVGLRKAGMPEE